MAKVLGQPEKTRLLEGGGPGCRRSGPKNAPKDRAGGTKGQFKLEVGWCRYFPRFAIISV